HRRDEQAHEELRAPAPPVRQRRLPVRTRFAALLLAVLATAGCTQQVAAAPEVVVPAPTNAFGGTDLAWIEINIAMNDQVLPLLALVPTRSDDPSLTQLSAQIQQDATVELTTLRLLHDQAGLPDENPHKGMLMPGVVPTEAVTSAAALTGAPFD